MPSDEVRRRLDSAREFALFGGSDSDVARVLKWYFDDARVRAISPLSQVIVPEFILRFPERAKRHFPGHPLTRRCVLPLPMDRVEREDLDPACADDALDILVSMDLMQPSEKQELLQTLR